MVDAKKFKEVLGIEPWNPLLEVADFNSLIALSQEFQVPVYALTEKQTGQVGAVCRVTNPIEQQETIMRDEN